MIKIGNKEYKFNERITLGMLKKAKRFSIDFQKSFEIVSIEDEDKLNSDWKNLLSLIFVKNQDWNVQFPEELELDNLQPSEVMEIIASFFMKIAKATTNSEIYNQLSQSLKENAQSQ